MENKPDYPVYVISKGRADICKTADFLLADKVDFHIVIEPQEKSAYAQKYGEDILYILPFSNLGLGSIPARNWVWEHAKESGAERHWILDDNIRYMHRRYKGKRIRCHSGTALKAVEDFVCRYENIGIAGINYSMFVGNQGGKRGLPPFFKNCRCYSCMLILNSLSHRWRGRYNEDTDLCLQVLASGLCTVLINAFSIVKEQTMKMKGGNTAELYVGDGRLKMAKSLERMWPGVIETKRRYKRPQHVVKDAWRRFDTPLIKKEGVHIDSSVNEYGLKLVQYAPIQNAEFLELVKDKLTD